jgi:hypothetical protein
VLPSHHAASESAARSTVESGSSARARVNASWARPQSWRRYANRAFSNSVLTRRNLQLAAAGCSQQAWP